VKEEIEGIHSAPDRIRDLAHEYGISDESLNYWLGQPNKHFQGEAPSSYIITGDPERIERVAQALLNYLVIGVS
jgi:Protein of unknown function (DUF2384)